MFRRFSDARMSARIKLTISREALAEAVGFLSVEIEEVSGVLFSRKRMQL